MNANPVHWLKTVFLHITMLSLFKFSIVLCRAKRLEGSYIKCCCFTVDLMVKYLHRAAASITLSTGSDSEVMWRS